jgi:hypothetical protein
MATNLDSVKMKELSDMLGIKMSNMELLWPMGYTKPEKFAGIDILDLIEAIGFKEARIALPKIEKAFNEGVIDQAVQDRIEVDAKWKKPGIGGLFAKTKKLHTEKENEDTQQDATPEDESVKEEEPQTKIKEKSGTGLNKLKDGFSILRKKEESNGDTEVKTKPGIGLARFKDKMKRKKDGELEPEETSEEEKKDEEPAVEKDINEEKKDDDGPKDEPYKEDTQALDEKPDDEKPDDEKSDDEKPDDEESDDEKPDDEESDDEKPDDEESEDDESEDEKEYESEKPSSTKKSVKSTE